MWKIAAGFPNYEVSDIGEGVRSVGHVTVSSNGRSRYFPGRLLKLQDPTGRGYLYAGLWRDRRLYQVRVGRLVLLTYVGPPPFPDAQTLHGNDVTDDDRLCNLRWGSGIENAEDAFRNGRRITKARCGRGHRFTEKNTYIRPDNGKRMCRQCMLDRNRKNRGVKQYRGLYHGRGESYVEPEGAHLGGDAFRCAGHRDGVGVVPADRR